MTVRQVDDLLTKLSGAGEKADSEALMRVFFSRCSALENKWVARIILRDMHLGVLENSVLKAFHPDALDLYGVCTDLRKVCLDLKDRGKRLEGAAGISVFLPFKPMLAAREALQDSVSLMNGKFFVEMKLDGERMQVHRQGKVVRYWSRKGKEYTYLYEKSLTPYILTPCFASHVESIILDGEMIAYDPVKEAFLPFGTLKSAALDAQPTEKSPRPCIVVFDIVFLNGESLIDKPLTERVALMSKVLIPKKGHMHVVNRTQGKTLQDIVDAVDQAIMRRLVLPPRLPSPLLLLLLLLEQ